METSPDVTNPKGRSGRNSRSRRSSKPSPSPEEYSGTPSSAAEAPTSTAGAVMGVFDDSVPVSGVGRLEPSLLSRLEDLAPRDAASALATSHDDPAPRSKPSDWPLASPSQRTSAAAGSKRRKGSKGPQIAVDGFLDPTIPQNELAVALEDRCRRVKGGKRLDKMERRVKLAVTAKLGHACHGTLLVNERQVVAAAGKKGISIGEVIACRGSFRAGDPVRLISLQSGAVIGVAAVQLPAEDVQELRALVEGGGTASEAASTFMAVSKANLFLLEWAGIRPYVIPTLSAFVSAHQRAQLSLMVPAMVPMQMDPRFGRAPRHVMHPAFPRVPQQVYPQPYFYEAPRPAPTMPSAGPMTMYYGGVGAGAMRPSAVPAPVSAMSAVPTRKPSEDVVPGAPLEAVQEIVEAPSEDRPAQPAGDEADQFEDASDYLRSVASYDGILDVVRGGPMSVASAMDAREGGRRRNRNRRNKEKKRAHFSVEDGTSQHSNDTDESAPSKVSLSLSKRIDQSKPRRGVREIFELPPRPVAEPAAGQAIVTTTVPTAVATVSKSTTSDSFSSPPLVESAESSSSKPPIVEMATRGSSHNSNVLTDTVTQSAPVMSNFSQPMSIPYSMTSSFSVCVPVPPPVSLDDLSSVSSEGETASKMSRQITGFSDLSDHPAMTAETPSLASLRKRRRIVFVYEGGRHVLGAIAVTGNDTYETVRRYIHQQLDLPAPVEQLRFLHGASRGRKHPTPISLKQEAEWTVGKTKSIAVYVPSMRTIVAAVPVSTQLASMAATQVNWTAIHANAAHAPTPVVLPSNPPSHMAIPISAAPPQPSSMVAVSAAASAAGASLHHARPARLLFLASSPLVREQDRPAGDLLSHASEFSALWAAVKESGKFLVPDCRIATRDELRLAAVRGVSILYYSGHGDRDSDGLLVERVEDVGRAALVSTEELRELFIEGRRAPKLVFVSACHSRRAGEAFVDAGTPHVVAVEAEAAVTEESARLFSRAFFSSLLCGHSVRRAFIIGRNAVARSDQSEADAQAKSFILLPAWHSGGTAKPSESGTTRSPRSQASEDPHEVVLFPEGSLEEGAIPSNPPHVPLAGIVTDVGNTIPSLPHDHCPRHRLIYYALSSFARFRLVSVTGAAGCGKSTLLRSTGAYLAERPTAAVGRVRDGVYFLRLGDVTDVESLVVALLRRFVGVRAKEAAISNSLHHTGEASADTSQVDATKERDAAFALMRLTHPASKDKRPPRPRATDHPPAAPVASTHSPLRVDTSAAAAPASEAPNSPNSSGIERSVTMPVRAERGSGVNVVSSEDQSSARQSALGERAGGVDIDVDDNVLPVATSMPTDVAMARRSTSMPTGDTEGRSRRIEMPDIQPHVSGGPGQTAAAAAVSVPTRDIGVLEGITQTLVGEVQRARVPPTAPEKTAIQSPVDGEPALFGLLKGLRCVIMLDQADGLLRFDDAVGGDSETKTGSSLDWGSSMTSTRESSGGTNDSKSDRKTPPLPAEHLGVWYPWWRREGVLKRMRVAAFVERMLEECPGVHLVLSSAFALSVALDELIPSIEGQPSRVLAGPKGVGQRVQDLTLSGPESGEGDVEPIVAKRMFVGPEGDAEFVVPALSSVEAGRMFAVVSRSCSRVISTDEVFQAIQGHEPSQPEGVTDEQWPQIRQAIACRDAGDAIACALPLTPAVVHEVAKRLGTPSAPTPFVAAIRQSVKAMRSSPRVKECAGAVDAQRAKLAARQSPALNLKTLSISSSPSMVVDRGALVVLQPGIVSSSVVHQPRGVSSEAPGQSNRSQSAIERSSTAATEVPSQVPSDEMAAPPQTLSNSEFLTIPPPAVSSELVMVSAGGHAFVVPQSIGFMGPTSGYMPSDPSVTGHMGMVPATQYMPSDPSVTGHMGMVPATQYMPSDPSVTGHMGMVPATQYMPSDPSVTGHMGMVPATQYMPSAMPIVGMHHPEPGIYPQPSWPTVTVDGMPNAPGTTVAMTQGVTGSNPSFGAAVPAFGGHAWLIGM
jgi:hypothetical protein